MKSSFLAALAMAGAFATVAPAFAQPYPYHHEEEWRRHEAWRDREWREHHAGYYAPPPVYAPPPRYYAPPPPVVYGAPGLHLGINIP